MKEITNDREKESDANESVNRRLTFWQVSTSILAAAFGVQSKKNRERDFSYGNPLIFILAGLAFTALFILAIVTIVYLVL
ncbi:MAG TPA: hypothetical protein DEQ32_08650 [Gammaproteobacteria bacterium]|nr:hypothetical protein [Gammaproteobacteria bacterium]|tara:strand:- start:1273 stop:1512 length:240 start_codon:yes stop_codon:yes gene_type:complete